MLIRIIKYKITTIFKEYDVIFDKDAPTGAMRKLITIRKIKAISKYFFFGFKTSKTHFF